MPQKNSQALGENKGHSWRAYTPGRFKGSISCLVEHSKHGVQTSHSCQQLQDETQRGYALRVRGHFKNYGLSIYVETTPTPAMSMGLVHARSCCSTCHFCLALNTPSPFLWTRSRIGREEERLWTRRLGLVACPDL
ncbi:hypothetical protein CY34DRAFT_244407 [Suillus luteus UH-Slu-Lm8-n1]|uniref:Uncharacterized protein n=1 Tax=Suillus luteus UH-Slu-Lm8-n1 TaxID=930992 RepID=A0A0D0BB58_9AGAM|nr:hypothetical protein CY34DRAFT_244407 [Suillus luteus UH-Slu-Lm8-n1]